MNSGWMMIEPSCVSRKNRGFTLLEVLVALAIAVIGIAAVAKATNDHVSTMQMIENRILANWVASNRMAELRINRTWPSTGESNEVYVMGGRNWYTTEKVSATLDEELRRIDLEVYRDDQREYRAGSIFGYISRPEPASE